MGAVRSDISFDISFTYTAGSMFVCQAFGTMASCVEPVDLPSRCFAFLRFDPCITRYNGSFAVTFADHRDTFADTAETSGRALSCDVLEFPAKL